MEEIKDFDYRECLATLTKSEILKAFGNSMSIFYNLDKKRTEDFELFSVMSERHYRESFHSDMIAILLNPETAEIGEYNRKYVLYKFLNLLNIPGNTYNDETVFSVKREVYTKFDGKQGFIDIEITFDKTCIIIENKINWAVEQDKQIQRYVANRSNHYDNVFAVMLYPIPSCVMVPEIKDDMKVFMWAGANPNHEIFPDSDKIKRLPESFSELLGKSIKELEEKNHLEGNGMTAYVVYKQYMNLLEKKGGKMDNFEKKKEFLTFLIANPGFRKNLEAGYKVWENRKHTFNQLFYKKFLKDEDYKRIDGLSNLETIKVKSYSYYVLKEFSPYKLLYYPNSYDYEGQGLDFAFVKNRGDILSEEEKDKFINIFQDALGPNGLENYSDKKPLDYNGWTIYITNPFIENKSLDEIYEIVFDDLRNIIKYCN